MKKTLEQSIGLGSAIPIAELKGNMRQNKNNWIYFPWIHDQKQCFNPVADRKGAALSAARTLGRIRVIHPPSTTILSFGQRNDCSLRHTWQTTFLNASFQEPIILKLLVKILRQRMDKLLSEPPCSGSGSLRHRDIGGQLFCRASTTATRLWKVRCRFVGCICDDLRHENWLVKGATILALGTIAKGCTNSLAPHLPTLVPYLTECMNDQLVLIRFICCWTLSRYCYWLIQNLQEDVFEALFCQEFALLIVHL
uniref:Uncharacterized protein n=1 Tax=Trichuris muris TaxID=70415 RepID=A0A5S6QD64_TRIMR